MVRIKCKIKGKTDLLMNSPRELNEAEVPKLQGIQIKKAVVPKDSAERVAYRLENGNLYIPSEAIKGTLLGAAKFKKYTKFSMKSFVAAAVEVFPEKIDLGIKDYIIDSRTVVNKVTKMRVMKHRPRIANWTAEFFLDIDETLLNDVSGVGDMLAEAGLRIGILDFRPEKGGKFGRFTVESYSEETQTVIKSDVGVVSEQVSDTKANEHKVPTPNPTNQNGEA